MIEHITTDEILKNQVSTMIIVAVTSVWIWHRQWRSAFRKAIIAEPICEKEGYFI